MLLVSGGNSYVLKLKMANATGLQTGAQVLVGGVPVGSVSDLEMDRAGNAVIVTLDLEKGKAHVGNGAHAAVIATNLLGTKSVQLQPGNRNEPLPSGTILPESDTSIPTDLDQIVDVLNQPTRVDLQLMLTEAGVAVAGRQADVSAILRQFPLSLTAATKLFQGLVTDNHSLADFIANSNAFIARVNANGPQLKRLLTSADGAAQTFSAQASELSRTIQEGPAFFKNVYSWFQGLGHAALNLTPVAAELAQSAGPLDTVLKQVRPFANAAVPTLNRAAQVAPTLNDLATQATPILKAAAPTVSSLSKIAELSQPLSAWLGLSSHDLFNIFDNWTHAIQFRDGVSHIFNGNIYLNPEIVLSAADKGATAEQKAQNLLDLAPNIVKQLGLQDAVSKAEQLLGESHRAQEHTGARRQDARRQQAVGSAQLGDSERLEQPRQQRVGHLLGVGLRRLRAGRSARFGSEPSARRRPRRGHGQGHDGSLRDDERLLVEHRWRRQSAGQWSVRSPQLPVGEVT